MQILFVFLLLLCANVITEYKEISVMGQKTFEKARLRRHREMFVGQTLFRVAQFISLTDT